ncbi:hypothetical protein J437_LFUL018657 [Ladona fulva]|uniref:Tc1-like transposase DDE domain-containing protein n=1 Tax=Ladona fulva TaxID=123851 RepID=A0A8K0KSB7_LADFU|nr:hypothetical protein J437_LFUL018657 [Ladona fulva]
MYVKERGRSGRLFCLGVDVRRRTGSYLEDRWKLRWEAIRWHPREHYDAIGSKELVFEKRIQQLSWPARSSDLNPIENIWDIMVREMKKKDRPLYANKILEDIKGEYWSTCVQSGHPINARAASAGHTERRKVDRL